MKVMFARKGETKALLLCRLVLGQTHLRTAARRSTTNKKLVMLSLFFWLCRFSVPASSQTTVLTYHNDNSRTGQNTMETVLTPSNVTGAEFGKLYSVSLDSSSQDAVRGQPLFVPNLPINGTRNVVFVATEADKVYAIDADNALWAAPGVPQYLWKATLTDPAYGAAPGATPASRGCRDPEGVTSTPVIDPSAEIMYVESKTTENGQDVHRLHALSILTGQEVGPGHVIISANNFNPNIHRNRPGLLLANGTVYVAFASNGCDQFDYHGWVFAYDAATFQQRGVFQVTTSSGALGGIWMAGAGLAADSSGNIFAATGNGLFDGGSNFGDSIVKLGPVNLNRLDFFTPFNQQDLFNRDIDLGSGGVLLLPDQPGAHPHLLVQAGKEGKIYLVDRDHMGGYCNGCDSDPQLVQELPGAVNGMWSMPTYWNNTVYFWAQNDVLKAFFLSNGLLNGTPARSGDSYGYPGSNLSISSNGNSNGIVWSIRTNNGGTDNDNPASAPVVLQAHAADDLRSLYSSDGNANRDGLNAGLRFTVPTVANGKVYVGTWGQLSVFGMLRPLGVSVSPSSGAGPTQTFTAAYSDPVDGNNIIQADLMILRNGALPGSFTPWTHNDCMVRYDPPTNSLFLYQDGGGWGPSTSMGGGGVLSNSQCTVFAAGSSHQVSGNTLSLTVQIAFNTANFSGSKQVYLDAANNAGGVPGFGEDYATQRGSWNVAACTYTLSPSSVVVASDGDSGSVAVSTFPACAWSAVPNSTWIHVSGPSSGVGSGTFFYDVDPNGRNVRRRGTISVANQLFNVAQDQSICSPRVCF